MQKETKTKEKTKYNCLNLEIGQGALEYLLLLAAAVVVVAVVISFMIGTIGPTEKGADKQTLEFQCVTLDSNTLACGCYLCDGSKGGYDDSGPTPKNSLANSTTCDAYYKAKGNQLFNPALCTGGYS